MSEISDDIALDLFDKLLNEEKRIDEEIIRDKLDDTINDAVIMAQELGIRKTRFLKWVAEAYDDFLTKNIDEIA